MVWRTINFRVVTEIIICYLRMFFIFDKHVISEAANGDAL